MENVTSINNIYSGKKTIIFLINFISCVCDRVQVEFSALYGVLGLESENVRFQKWEIYFRSILDRASSVDFLEKRKIWNIQNTQGEKPFSNLYSQNNEMVRNNLELLFVLHTSIAKLVPNKKKS